MNNRGSLQDLMLLLVFGFIFTIFAIVGIMTMNNINTELQASDDISSEGKEHLQEAATNMPKFVDNAFLIILVGMGILIFVTGALLNTNPIFFVFSIVILSVVVGLAALMANVYEDVVSNPEIANAESGLVIMPFIYENYPIVFLGLGILLIIGLFAKFGGGGI